MPSCLRLIFISIFFFSNFSVCQKQTRSAARQGFHQLNPAKPDFVFPRWQEALAVVHRADAEVSCFFFFSAVDKLMWEKIHSIDFSFPVAFERLLMQRVHKSTHMSVCTVISNKLTFLETIFSLYFRWLDLWSRWYLLAHNYSFRGCVKGWRINFDALSGALNISPITHTSFSLCSSLLELSSEVLGIIFFFAGWKPFVVQTLPRANPRVWRDYEGDDLYPRRLNIS